MAIYVADAIMSSGKTEAAIHFINSSPAEKRFLFITPFLSECDRIINSCHDRHFKAPTERGKRTKGIDLQNLLKMKQNIATTHALFLLHIHELSDLIKEGEYTLIQDEALPLLGESDLSELAIGKDDIPFLLEHGIINKDTSNKITFPHDTYNGSMFQPLQEACQTMNMYYNNTVLFEELHTEIFGWFMDVYILTYLFKYSIQRYVFDIHRLEYTFIGVEKTDGHYQFTDHITTPEYSREYSSRIHIADGEINDIGNSHTSLSHSWFEKQCAIEKKRQDNSKKNETDTTTGKKKKTAARTELQKLGSHIESFFKRDCKADNDAMKELCLWTVFKNAENLVNTHSHKSRFVVFNLKASNDYRNKKYLAYCVNVFLNPVLINFLQERGTTVNNEGYALSEMIQWIWRSAIRNETDEIIVYVPSSRMRTLLQAWLEELQNGGHGDEEHIFERAKELMRLMQEKVKENKGKKNSGNRKTGSSAGRGKKRPINHT